MKTFLKMLMNLFLLCNLFVRIIVYDMNSTKNVMVIYKI